MAAVTPQAPESPGASAGETDGPAEQSATVQEPVQSAPEPRLQSLSPSSSAGAAGAKDCGAGDEGSPGSAPAEKPPWADVPEPDLERAAQGAEEEEPGVVAQVFGLMRCRRRAPRELALAGGDVAYRGLLDAGRHLTQDERRSFERMAWWSDAETSPEAKVFVFCPRGMDGSLDGDVDMWALLSYAVSAMHERVVEKGEKYSIVWVQANDHRMWGWSAWQFRRSLHTMFFDKADAVHLVHPSWASRLFNLALWPVVEESFWQRYVSHERVEFLEQYLNISNLLLPKDVMEYDQFLDRESAVMSETLLINGGTSNPYSGSGVLCESQRNY